ncbi:MAG: Si-specific NAD(P)(+) transhydrogenase [Planctomycetota bacterium]|nr:Si-specific NAD(P)(+) transhydrogenase [Planctomycetota bacterium]
MGFGKDTYDLVVIGSGPAGQSAAIQASKLHKRVAIVEKEPRVGGVCAFTGTIPSKTLREAIIEAVGPGRLGGGEWHLTRRPEMSELLERVGQVMKSEAAVVRDSLARNDVEVIQAEASFIDAHRIALDEGTGRRVIETDQVLVACGTKAAAPPTGPSDGQRILTSDDIVGLKELPSSLAVVGGGVIGVEYASIFATAGVQVTLVDRRERLLEFVDREIVDELMHQMRNFDVTFRLGEAVARVELFEEGNRSEVDLELESGKRIVSEAVLFSIGRTPVTGPLSLPKAGVEVDDRGRVPVDDSFRTNVDNIYAAGDVIGFPALAATSSEQGRIAACRMFGIEAADFDSSYPYGIYAIPEISMCGDTEESLTAERIPYEIGVARYRETARGQIMGDDTGMFKMIFHRETRRLLGVHCIGTHATELIHIGQAVIALGGDLDYFLNAVFNYPTLAEVYKIAAHNAANRLRHVRRASVSSSSNAEPVMAAEVPERDDPRPVPTTRLTERTETTN